MELKHVLPAVGVIPDCDFKLYLMELKHVYVLLGYRPFSFKLYLMELKQTKAWWSLQVIVPLNCTLWN